MLIKCPECRTKISNKAPQCLKCGAPIAAIAGGGVVTVELTSKRWKAMRVYGVAICDPSRPFAPIARVAARRRMGKSC